MLNKLGSLRKVYQLWLKLLKLGQLLLLLGNLHYWRLYHGGWRLSMAEYRGVVLRAHLTVGRIKANLILKGRDGTLHHFQILSLSLDNVCQGINFIFKVTNPVLLAQCPFHMLAQECGILNHSFLYHPC